MNWKIVHFEQRCSINPFSYGVFVQTNPCRLDPVLQAEYGLIVHIVHSDEKEPPVAEIFHVVKMSRSPRVQIAIGG